MANIFDQLQVNTFDTVTKTMGYPASWLPAGGGPVQTAEVLYKDSTEKYELSNQDFDPLQWRMEYRYGFFTTLKNSVDNTATETVIISLPEGDVEFYVRRVDTIVDGKTFIAYLQKKV